jgi:putative ABC transport system permease protein
MHYADDINTSSQMPGLLAPALQETFPEIISSARYFNPEEMLIRSGEKGFYESKVVGTDPSFFDIFTYPFARGNPETALDDPFSIVLTKKMAKKYFKDEDPLGKVLHIDNRFDVKITGVLENLPLNSHFTFDFIVPFKFLQDTRDDLTNWTIFRCESFLLLQNSAQYMNVSAKISNFIHMKASMETRTDLFLYPFTHYHIREGMSGILIKLVYLFTIIGILILSIACINFMNLSTARALNRTKEIGMRKVIGAGRGQLIKQFMSESVIFAFISFLVALVIIQLVLPYVNKFIRLNLSLNILNLDLFFGLALIVLITGLLAGSYPAFFLSSFHPIRILKGMLITGVTKARLRKILVITQFTIAIILMIFTAFVFLQLKLIQTIDPGFNKESIVYIPLRGNLQNFPENDKVKRELLSNPNILNVTMSHNRPNFIVGSGWYWHWEGKHPDESIIVYETSIDYDFMETFNLRMVKGRSFSIEHASDLSNSVIINEKAVQIMGFENPIGNILRRFDDQYTIIGVVKNFNFLPISEDIGPLALRFRSDENRHMYAKIVSNDFSQTLSHIKEVFNRHNPNYPHEIKFLDQEADILEKFVRPFAEIVFIITLIAISISCLGILGLASHTAEKRTKEVGIRKVLGASITWLVLALSKEFTKSVLIANIIALPLAYVATKAFLQIFAFRVDLEPWIFIIIVVISLLIALITVSYQAIKSAVANPIEALRYE